MKYEWIVEIDDDEGFHLEEAKWKQEVVRCKDCKYFHYNKIYDIQGFPIMGNYVCDKWANGCQTDENGYCFLGERKENK